MRCDMTILVDGPDNRGWRKWRCSRCPKQTNWTPDDSDNIHFQCEGWPQRWEVGTWASLLLEAAFGITKLRWVHIKRLLGTSPQCGCNERQHALNTLGQRITSWLSSIAGFARRIAGSTPGTAISAESTAAAAEAAASPTSEGGDAGAQRAEIQ